MKKRLMIGMLTAALVCGLWSVQCSTAEAQATKNPTQSSATRLKNFRQALEQLDLSAGQKTQIKQYMTQARQQLHALKSAAAGGTTDKTQARQILRETIKKVLAVLTPSQKIKLKQLLKADRG